MAAVRAFDPVAAANLRSSLPEVVCADAMYDTLDGAAALVICTEWDQYRELDYGRIYAGMEKPAFVFDGRNILDHRALFEIGYHVFPIGKKALTHFEAL